MDDLRGQNVRELRERAAHYRRLARGPMAWSLVQELERLAKECDRELSSLVAERPVPMRKAVLDDRRTIPAYGSWPDCAESASDSALNRQHAGR